MNIQELNNISLKAKRITVLGLGRSGIGAARLAKFHGAEVFISDSGYKSNFDEMINTLSKEGIEVEVNGHSESIFESDLIIISPGIPCDSQVVKDIQDKNIPIVGEIEFAYWYAKAPIIALTGSNGKTTTVNAIFHMLIGSEYNPKLAGNMGVSLSDVVLADLMSTPDNRIYVVEISSFQMEFIQHFKPRIAVYLNITPDHLDRHGDMETYAAAKFRMVENMSNDDFIVFNADDNLLIEKFGNFNNSYQFTINEDSSNLFSISNGHILSNDGNKLCRIEDIFIPGEHNLSNLLAAATASKLAGVSIEKIAKSFKEFQGVTHRMEFVGMINDALFINDSKATNVDAVKVALKSYTQPVILLLGGKDKAGNFKELIPLTHNVQCILAFGKAKDVIAAALVDAVRLKKFDSLKDAVAESKRLARPGDVVLLSPGCASFDEFENFEHRGNVFKELVIQESAA